MKRTLLLILPIFLVLKLSAQQKTDSAILFNVITKETVGEYKDPHTNQSLGQMHLVYTIDTLKKELQKVTFQLMGEKTTQEIYHYKNNQLEQVVEAEVTKHQTIIKDWFNFSASERGLDKRKMQELSATNRKYTYLLKSNDYLRILDTNLPNNVMSK